MVGALNDAQNTPVSPGRLKAMPLSWISTASSSVYVVPGATESTVVK
jgi:hypothetical protein